METSAEYSAGYTAFDVRDRLAIINVINSYGYYIDQSRFNEFCDLFTELPTIQMWSGQDLRVDEWEKYRDLVIDRQRAFERNNVQRRHVLATPRFDFQNEHTASGQAYVLLNSTENGVSTLVSSGYYEFTTVNRSGRWRIDRWIGHIDAGEYGKGVGK
ncbi:nuclear transport factor 2 family protein [Rhodococcus sp. NPDC057014]|uniref:nuclear transport factor 2 family protein n=1 Tax=Rhodococcus sp. NPDC057014 TaxID=3346000 RepID=UPI003624AF4A